MTNFDIVNVAVNLPGVATNVKCDINSEGTACIISYHWAKVMFNFDDMFKKAIDGGSTHSDDSRIVSFKTGLEKVRTRIDAAPTGKITINFLIAVKTTPDSFKYGGVSHSDGALVFFGKFSGLSKEYNEKIQDSAMLIDL